MSATIIDGKAIAAQVRGEVAEKVSALKAKGITPCLAVILVGENPASVSYVTGKQKALAEVGMADRSLHLPESTTEEELLKIIDDLNKDTAVHGILVQLPLPEHINEEKVLLAIDPEKDVDGFHPMNVGNLVIGKKAFLPCTPHGIIVLLEKMGIEIKYHHPEVGAAGQFEIEPMLGQMSKMADATMMIKYIIHNTARKYGMSATFMPKPIYGINGSGMHCNLSLFKNGKNIKENGGDTDTCYDARSTCVMWRRQRRE